MGDEDDEDGSDEENMDEDERPSSSGEAGDADVAVTTPEQVELSFGASIASSQEKVVETVVIETEVDDTVSGVRSSEKVTVTTETMTTITTETLMTVSPATIDVKSEAANGVAIEGDRLESPTTVLMPASNGHSPEKMPYESESSIVAEFDLNGEHAAWVSNGGDRTETSMVEALSAPNVLKAEKVSEVGQDEPLDFSKYQSAEEMEV